MLKKTIVILTFLITGILPAFADAPGLVNYQGRLRESGVPATGSKTMVFRLYDDPSGGAVVWTSDTVSVDVDRGVFSYKLGSADPDSSGRYINNLAWSNSSVTYWLELTIDGKTLLPRERFTTVPFAFQATNADTLDGYHAATFASTTTAHALAFSTGTIQTQVNALAVSTGTLQSQLNSVAVSTTSLQTQLNSVAGSTSSVQGQVNALAVSTGTLQIQLNSIAFSTGSIQSRVNDLAYSTGTLSAAFANYQLNLSTPSWQAYDSARLGSQLPSFYSQLNATQTFTAQKTFLNQITVSSNAVVTGNAGIGTAAPADRLHVSDGNVRIQGGTPILYLQNTDSPAGTASILNWQKNLIFKNGDGDERLQIREDNNVVINPSDGNVGIGTAGPSGWFQVGPGTFTVLSNGKVGIGATNPWERLQVNGAIVSGDSSSTTGSLLLAGQYNGANNYITTFGSLYSSGGPVVGYGVKPRSGAAGYVSSTDIDMFRSAINVESFISFLSAPSQAIAVDAPVTMTENMRILNNGNIGIGTTNPSGWFQVGPGTFTVLSNGKVGIGTVNPSHQGSGLHIHGTSTVGTQLRLSNEGNPAAAWELQAGGPGNQAGAGSFAVLQPGVAYRMVISSSSGNVGIGTISPEAKLDVNGSIKISTGSIYTTTWTDVSFGSGWSNYGGGTHQTCQYKKVGDFVCLRGLATSGSNLWSSYPVICTLPEGCRPKQKLVLVVYGESVAVRVDAQADGTIRWYSGGNGSGWISLDGITFSVD